MEEFWETKRGKAIIKLAIWSIFLLVVFFIVTKTDNNSVNNRETYKEEQEVELSIRDLLKELLNSNYEYEYIITVNDIEYLFKGEYKQGVDKGYKESDSGIIKYEIENDIVYQIVKKEIIEIDDFYTGLNKDYLDLSFINNLLDREPTDNNTYVIENVEYIISNDDKHITKIEINDEEFIYNLEFSNIEVY